MGYPFDKKKKLANKIGTIKNPTYLREIRDIIINNNKNISIIKSGEGILLLFNNLNDNTYLILEQYLKKIEKNKINYLINTLNSSDNYDSSHIFTTNTNHHDSHNIKFHQ